MTADPRLSLSAIRSAHAPVRHWIADRFYRPILQKLSGPSLVQADGHCVLPPRWLLFGINNACNLHCKMCDVGLDDDRTAFWANLIGAHPQNMPEARFYKALEQAQAFHPRPRIGLVYTEPLLHPKVIDFVQAISDARMFSSITTNGYLLKRRAEALVDAGLHWLNVSIDGPAAVHNRIRGSRDSFERAFAGIQQVLAHRGRQHFPRIRISCTITDENHEHLVDLVRELQSLDIDQILISQLCFITEEMAAVHNASYGDLVPVTRSNLGIMEPASFDIAPLFKELQQLRIMKNVVLTPAALSIDQLEQYYRNPMQFVGGRRCTDTFELMMVQTTGSVIPGPGRCFDYKMGSIEEQSLTEIWNGSRIRTLRRTLQAAGGSLPACARCCGVIGKV